MAATTPANPLLAADGLPAFDRIAPTDVVPAVEALLADAHAAIEKLEADVAPTYDATIEALDAIDRPFERGWSPVGHLLGVKNSDELRDAHEAAIPQMVAYSLRASQSRPIFEALKALADGPEFAALPSAKRRIVTQRLLSAELGGVGLDGEDREAFNKLAEEMSQLTTKFSNNVLDATKAFGMTLTDPADAAGFPATLRSVASQAHNDHVAKDGVDGEPGTPEAGPWRITLDYPSYGPFMEHSRNRTQREQLYRAFATRASDGDVDNTPLVDRILEIRRRQSALLGREHFADVSLATKMAGTVDAVHGLLEKLRDASWAHGEKELAELADRFAADTGLSVDDLAPWDTAFYAERLREERYGFTDEELRPYFAFERVLDGLFALCGRLFGITMTAADGDAPVWNDDVRYFTVQDSETGEQIAAFYLDPYSRPADKRGGAWMADCLQRRRLPDGSLQLPVAHLVCNQTPPAGGKPSLMSFREVETLFHEFGHGLQHMLTTVDEADAAGIAGVEWDAVELPSQFMENWCYHRPTLLGMTAHYETGEPLPEDLFEKIVAARTHMAATQMLRQLQFGLTDMALHAGYDPATDGTPFDVGRRVAEKTSILPLPDWHRGLCAFSHIFAGGYSAGYYSYKWAEVLSADAFGAFEEAGLDDEAAVAATGRRFRDTVLAEGGSRHPADIFRDFRGREPSPEPLLRHSGLL